MRLRKSVILCAVAVPAMACAGQPDQWYVAPQLGAFSPNYQRSLEKNDWLYGVALGREINRYFNLELNIDGTRLSGIHGVGPMHIYGTTLDALAILNRNGRLSPYLRLHCGRHARTGRSPEGVLEADVCNVILQIRGAARVLPAYFDLGAQRECAGTIRAAP